MANISRYGIISKDIARDPCISSSAKTVYLVLSTYANNNRCCYPSHMTLCAETGLSMKTLIKAIKELETKEVLLVKRGCRGNSCKYKLLDEDGAGMDNVQLLWWDKET